MYSRKNRKVFTKDAVLMHIEDNLSYLPQPNSLEIILGSEESPAPLTPTAFVFPFTNDGKMVLARHIGEEASRGISVPGGHVDPGEDSLAAARREGWEETGVVIGDMIPVGYQRSTIHGPVPDDYRYPAPVSHQQFYAGLVVKGPGEVTEEQCGDPLVIDPADGLKALCRRRDRMLCFAAIKAAQEAGWVHGVDLDALNELAWQDEPELEPAA
jgi:8-oxo-dGTP pyrophosphatase MutT (NUDIX family)